MPVFSSFNTCIIACLLGFVIVDFMFFRITDFLQAIPDWIKW